METGTGGWWLRRTKRTENTASNCNRPALHYERAKKKRVVHIARHTRNLQTPRPLLPTTPWGYESRSVDGRTRACNSFPLPRCQRMMRGAPLSVPRLQATSNASYVPRNHLSSLSSLTAQLNVSLAPHTPRERIDAHGSLPSLRLTFKCSARKTLA